MGEETNESDTLQTIIRDFVALEMSDVNALVEETLKLIERGLLQDPGGFEQVTGVRMTNEAWLNCQQEASCYFPRRGTAGKLIR